MATLNEEGVLKVKIDQIKALVQPSCRYQGQFLRKT